MIVWALVVGNYWPREVLSLHLTREGAEAALEAMNTVEDIRIESWEVQP